MLEYNDQDDAPPIVVNVYDSDPKFMGGLFGLGGDDDPTDKDDYIGRALIFMDQIGVSNDFTTLLSLDDTISKPTWYPLKQSMNSPYAEENGPRVLLSLAKIDFDENYAVEAN
jgi:hypothetical protein